MKTYYHDGFTFYTKEEAMLAEVESKRVEYMEERIDYTNPARVLSIYNKAVDEGIFKGQVGLTYLRKIQEYLFQCPDISSDMIQAIPAWEPVSDVTPKKQKKEKPIKTQQLMFSVIMNIALVIAVIAMFAIALTSEQPNILNYEKNLQNKYAAWEQELNKKEQELRKKERELSADEDTEYLEETSVESLEENVMTE